jgi:Fucose permease
MNDSRYTLSTAFIAVILTGMPVMLASCCSADVSVSDMRCELMERCGLAVAQAGLGSSVYFLCRTAGAFFGTFLLLRIDNVKYFRIFIIITSAAVAMLFASCTEWMILLFVGIAGFAAAAIFSVIFSQAMLACPDKKNEVSGLMITGVCGGGVVAPLMGLLASGLGNQNGSIAVILLCAAYLCFLSFSMR